MGDAAWLETTGGGDLAERRFAAEMLPADDAAGRGSAGRAGAVVGGRGCAGFAGIVWAHCDAKVLTAVLNFKRKRMAMTWRALRPTRYGVT